MARPRRQYLLAPVLAALTLAACTSGTAPTPPAFSVVSSTPSAAPRSLSAEEEATQLAKGVIEKYWAAIPRCLADPSTTPMTCFDDVAISTELQDLKNALAAAQQVQSKATGQIRIVSMEVVGLDLTNRVTETPPTVPLVTYRVCLDVSQFRMVGKTGDPIAPATRTPRSSTEMTVVNYHLPDPSQWRIGYQIAKGTAC